MLYSSEMEDCCYYVGNYIENCTVASVLNISLALSPLVKVIADQSVEGLTARIGDQLKLLAAGLS